MKTKVFLTIGGVLLMLLSAQAHHSFSSEFDINQPIKLTGVLTKVDWVSRTAGSTSTSSSRMARS